MVGVNGLLLNFHNSESSAALNEKSTRLLSFWLYLPATYSSLGTGRGSGRELCDRLYID